MTDPHSTPIPPTSDSDTGGDARHVADLLAGLGDTADQVRNGLAAAKVQGRIGSPSLCAVAEHLRRAGHPVRVYPTGVIKGERHDGAVVLADDTSLPLPTAVDWFLHRFDCGQYPELVAS